jgi:N-acetylmuramoyl-L-alanine amidase
MKFLHCLALLGALLLAGCATRVQDTSRTFQTVVIDPGHGGHDSGTRSRGGIQEKTLALDVALRLDEKLRGAGFRTVMTRHDDRFIPLDQRAQISNAEKNAIFVSIHFNDTRKRGIRGVEIYFHSATATDLAGQIESSVSALTNARGIHRANFRVLRLARYPAVLVECGYLSNSREASRANSPAYRELLAAHIADALVTKRYGKTAPEQATHIAAKPGISTASPSL